MRDHDDRDAFIVELIDEGIHFGRNEGVQACYRLIQKEHFLCSAKSSCEEYSLLLSAGQISVALFSKAADSQKGIRIREGKKIFRK